LRPTELLGSHQRERTEQDGWTYCSTRMGGERAGELIDHFRHQLPGHRPEQQRQ